MPTFPTWSSGWSFASASSASELAWWRVSAAGGQEGNRTRTFDGWLVSRPLDPPSKTPPGPVYSPQYPRSNGRN